MSPSPASKRRRLAASSATLSRPFKSPLKTPTNQPLTPLFPPTPLSAISPLPPTFFPTRTQPRPTTTTTTTTNPLATLQKRHTALLTTLAHARASLETSSQALKLERSSTDRDLEASIARWKKAGREAAEEVFGFVGKRVEGMGGVRGWRGMERERGRGGWGWDERRGEGKGDGDGEGDGEVEEDVEEEEGEGAEEGDEEEGFTMDMMLRSLNIDLGLIGYDKEAQKWID